MSRNISEQRRVKTEIFSVLFTPLEKYKIN